MRALCLILALAPPIAWAEPTFEVVGTTGQSLAISKEPLTYRAVSLAKVLALAGISFNEPLRAPLLAASVRVEAADGYKVSFSLAELDPRTGSTDARLAFELAGKPLETPLEPYRLLVPTDQRAARWVRQLTRIVVTL